MEVYDQRRDYDAFREALPSLMKSHSGEIVVMHDCKPVRFFTDMEAAVRFGTQEFGDQSFIAQPVNDDAPTVLSYSLAI